MIRNDLPAASVILPVYNAGKYLDSEIESVLGQSFTDFEVLLLNAGSTDGSLSRLEWFAARDSRCRVFSWPNRGADVVIATWWETAEWVNALSRKKGEKIYFEPLAKHRLHTDFFAARGEIGGCGLPFLA